MPKLGELDVAERYLDSERMELPAGLSKDEGEVENVKKEVEIDG